MKKQHPLSISFLMFCIIFSFIKCDRNSIEPKNEDEFKSLGNGIYSRNVKDTDYESEIEAWNAYTGLGTKEMFRSSNEADISSTLEIKTENDSDLRAILETRDNINTVYYMLNGKIASQFELFITKEKDTTIIRYTNALTREVTELHIDKNGFLIKDATTRGLWGDLQDAGKDTAACIEDAYTNHGWSSVFAGVASAFLPQVAAGIALVCGVRNMAKY